MTFKIFYFLQEVTYIHWALPYLFSIFPTCTYI